MGRRHRGAARLEELLAVDAHLCDEVFASKHEAYVARLELATWAAEGRIGDKADADALDRKRGDSVPLHFAIAWTRQAGYRCTVWEKLA